MIKRYGASVSPRRTPATMSKYYSLGSFLFFLQLQFYCIYIYTYIQHFCMEYYFCIEYNFIIYIYIYQFYNSGSLKRKQMIQFVNKKKYYSNWYMGKNSVKEEKIKNISTAWKNQSSPQYQAKRKTPTVYPKLKRKSAQYTM